MRVTLALYRSNPAAAEQSVVGRIRPDDLQAVA